MIDMIRIDRELQNFDSARVPIKSSERTVGDVPYLGASGEVDRVQGYTHDGDYLCVSEDGENLRSLNTPIAWVQRGKFWANNHLHVLGGLPVARLRFYEAALAIAPIRSYLTGSAQPKLSQAALHSIMVPYFSPLEQTAIGEVMGALDDKIAANRHLVEVGQNFILARWERLTKMTSETIALRQVAEINPKVPNSTESIPAYIEMKRLPEHGLLIDSIDYRVAKGGVRFVNDDTLMARITPCFENGKMALVDLLGDGEIGYGSTEYLVFRPGQGVSPAIPYAIVASEDFRTFAARSMIGTSGRQRVQAKGLNEYLVAWPSAAERDEFGVFADMLLSRLGAARDENARLAATRDELLPLLMNGKITVKDAEKTVEDVV